MRAMAAVILGASLVACSGSAGRTIDTPAPPGASKANAVTPAVVSSSAPLVKMAAGTDLVDGVLASWCEGSDCSRAPGVRPLRYLAGEANGLLLFQSSVAPARAIVELRRNGKVVERDELEPGTMMAYGSRRPLPGGRYKVVLIASWQQREGRWVFGVTGPLGEET